MWYINILEKINLLQICVNDCCGILGEQHNWLTTNGGCSPELKSNCAAEIARVKTCVYMWKGIIKSKNVLCLHKARGIFSVFLEELCGFRQYQGGL